MTARAPTKRTTQTTAKERRDWRPVFLEAYARLGIISGACKVAKVGRTNVYTERVRNAEFAAAWDELEQHGIDEVELAARMNALGGNATMQMFLLKTRRREGRARPLRVIGRVGATCVRRRSSVVGTNGQLTVGGGTTTLTGYQLGPGAPAPIVGSGATTGTATTRTAAQGPFVLSPVNPGNSATVNDNCRITNGITSGIPQTCGSDNTSGTDQSSGVTFNPTTRVLSMANNSTLTLGGGTYNFCNFTAGNNANITIAATVKTQIFIDSPDDPNSGCASGTGNFTLSQNDTFTNSSGDPTAAQLYVYGLNNGTNVVTFYNNTNSYVSLYAPQSTVTLSPSSNTTFDGAIAANNITVGNKATFTFDAEDSTLTAGTTALYYRTAWEQCPATPTNASDPTSGC